MGDAASSSCGNRSVDMAVHPMAWGPNGARSSAGLPAPALAATRGSAPLAIPWRGGLPALDALCGGSGRGPRARQRAERVPTDQVLCASCGCCATRRWTRPSVARCRERSVRSSRSAGEDRAGGGQASSSRVTGSADPEGPPGTTQTARGAERTVRGQARDDPRRMPLGVAQPSVLAGLEDAVASNSFTFSRCTEIQDAHTIDGGGSPVKRARVRECEDPYVIAGGARPAARCRRGRSRRGRPAKPPSRSGGRCCTARHPPETGTGPRSRPGAHPRR